MRQGQQHRRGVGRSRKPQNALSRNYESNGPNGKLRGTAAQIAEKYLSLAREALASGDMVTAESYFQHAEHYNRIIMATRIQSGGDGGHIRERSHGGRNMPGLASEHGRMGPSRLKTNDCRIVELVRSAFPWIAVSSGPD